MNERGNTLFIEITYNKRYAIIRMLGIESSSHVTSLCRSAGCVYVSCNTQKKDPVIACGVYSKVAKHNTHYT